MQTGTLIALAIYFIAMLSIGFYAWRKSTADTEGYLLGGRDLGPAVTALSAGASDMSGWLMLGLPGAIFASGLVTNMDAAGIRRKVSDVGGQLDFRLNMLSTLDLTLSIGGAIAFEQESAPRREAMISLKVLR